ncbi:MAG: hypothetical protein KGH53_03365 [Candidatus Micrarchaeota archaeon]|nr:hypothetical protein [Candidatus Micrarchaeota archaeon]
MDEMVKEWTEILLWFVLPLIITGAIAYFEYLAHNTLVAAIFALFFLGLLARRMIVATTELEPLIIEAGKRKLK